MSMFGVFLHHRNDSWFYLSFFCIVFIIEVKMRKTKTYFIISNVLPGCLLMPSLPLIVMRLTPLFIAFIIFHVL